MARIKFVHAPEYSYRNPVGLMRHRLMLRPDDSHDLRFQKAELTVSPLPSTVFWKHDVCDNSVCFLEWPETLRTKTLKIESAHDLFHHPDRQSPHEYSFEPSASTFPFSYAQAEFRTWRALPNGRCPIRTAR